MHLLFIPLAIKLNLSLDKVKRVESLYHTHAHTLLLVLRTQRLSAKKGKKYHQKIEKKNYWKQYFSRELDTFW